MIAANDFIAAFPEFSNNVTYPLAQINFWIPQAYNQLNADRFGASLDLAAMLFVAHNIVLSAREAAATSQGAGGIPGQATGPVTSKGVGQVSLGYDTKAMQIPGAGPWNATTYGQRLYRMMVAASAVFYVPGGGRSTWPSWASNGWVGGI